MDRAEVGRVNGQLAPMSSATKRQRASELASDSSVEKNLMALKFENTADRQVIPRIESRYRDARADTIKRD